MNQIFILASGKKKPANCLSLKKQHYQQYNISKVICILQFKFGVRKVQSYLEVLVCLLYWWLCTEGRDEDLVLCQFNRGEVTNLIWDTLIMSCLKVFKFANEIVPSELRRWKWDTKKAFLKCFHVSQLRTSHLILILGTEAKSSGRKGRKCRNSHFLVCFLRMLFWGFKKKKMQFLVCCWGCCKAEKWQM